MFLNVEKMRMLEGLCLGLAQLSPVTSYWTS